MDIAHRWAGFDPDATDPENLPEEVCYRNLVVQYLSHVAHFLTDYRCFKEDEEHLSQLIPGALLEITPGPLPRELVVPNEF